jgi:hypothetical protein
MDNINDMLPTNSHWSVKTIYIPAYIIYCVWRRLIEYVYYLVYQFLEEPESMWKARYYLKKGHTFLSEKDVYKEYQKIFNQYCEHPLMRKWIREYCR